jgi:hypothetical protein
MPCLGLLGVVGIFLSFGVVLWFVFVALFSSCRGGGGGNERG